MFEKLTDPKDVVLWEGRVPIRHRYTPGVAGEAFFTTLRDRGEFLASRCESCGITYCPARLFCERCFDGPLAADRTAGPQGTVESFTVGYRGIEGQELEEPVTVGLIRLDGADTVLVHFLLGEGFGLGDRVEAVLHPKARRSGSILDVRGFRAADRRPR
jgi:uncharacterized OB-fold protein